MSINYESNLNEIIRKLKEAKNESLETVGVYGETKTKENTPVSTGDLQKSVTHKVEYSRDFVDIGTPHSMYYSPYVHEGTRFQRANKFIERGISHNIDEIENIAVNIFNNKLR